MVRNAPWLVHLATFAVLGAAIIIAPGCTGRGVVVARADYTTDYDYYGDEAAIVVYRRPPAPRFEMVLGPAPGPEYIWIPGYWDWQDHWVWVGGRWDVDRPGYAWTPPIARVVAGRVHYHHGFWRPSDRPLPRVYMQPGRIALTARVQAPPEYRARVEGVRPSIIARPAEPMIPPGHMRGRVDVEAPRAEVRIPPGHMRGRVDIEPPRAEVNVPPGHMRGRVDIEPPRAEVRVPPGHMRGRVEVERGPVYRPMPPAAPPERRVEVGPGRAPDVAPPPGRGRGRVVVMPEGRHEHGRGHR